MLATAAHINTELTGYAIQLLAKHKILTVREFLNEDASRLSKIVNLAEADVGKVKRDLRSHYGPQRYNIKSSFPVFGTGIQSLDDLLGEETLAAGNVWEICGLSGHGKTQLCHSIALNFARQYQHHVLYLDTKFDFSGVRTRRMLRTRQVDKLESGRIMHQIKIERATSTEEVVDVLEKLLQLMERADDSVAAIKLIVIDSLPAVWFLLHTEDSRTHGNFLLSKIANLLHKLATSHSLAVLVVNLSIPLSTQELENIAPNADEDLPEEFDPENGAANNENLDCLTRPALGRYWSSVPRIRLLVELCNEDRSARTIKVLKSCYSSSKETCLVYVNDGGVV